jgi:hypothetical protein
LRGSAHRLLGGAAPSPDPNFHHSKLHFYVSGRPVLECL